MAASTARVRPANRSREIVSFTAIGVRLTPTRSRRRPPPKGCRLHFDEPRERLHEEPTRAERRHRVRVLARDPHPFAKSVAGEAAPVVRAEDPRAVAGFSPPGGETLSETPNPRP